MKKLLLILFSIAFFSQSFAQHKITYNLKVNYSFKFLGRISSNTITSDTGTFYEGTPLIVPPYTMPNKQKHLQAVYNSIVGATFLLPVGALNNDIRLDITLDSLNLNGLPGQVANEKLFLRLKFDVYDPADSKTPYEGHYVLNDTATFTIPWEEPFTSFVDSAVIDTTLLFAYIEGNKFSSVGITTLRDASSISFKATHFSTIGGGSASIVNVKENSTTEIPNIYTLEQNYPNPFNPTTNINFSLPESGFVTLKVYNTLGAEVKTFISNSMSAGNHSVEFNAQNLPSGIYFYTLNSNNITITKKMLLLK